MTEVKPGLYKNVPFETYNGWPFVRNSDLTHFRRTPAHAREYMLRKKEESTAALEFGRAYHAAVLEPDLFRKSFVAGIKVDRRTKEGKAAWADFCDENAERTVLAPEDMDQLLAMQARIAQHPAAKALLYGEGQSEVSIVWVDAETGLTCKSRIDRIAEYEGRTVLIDLKTTERDASEKGFQNAMARYGYHVQAGMYSLGMETLYPGPVRKFIFVVQEKERPYEPAVYELDGVSIEQGKAEFRRHLSTLKDCVVRDEWPGHGDGVGLIGIPQWAASDLDYAG